MSQHSNHPQHPQMEPLSPSEVKLIHWWRKKHLRAAVINAVFLLLLAACCVWMYDVTGNEENLLVVTVALVCFMPVALWNSWILVRELKKAFNLQAALSTGTKYMISGTLHSLTVNPKQSTLLYTIDETTIRTICPKALHKINQSSHLQQAQVRLKYLPLTAKDNLLLGVSYPEIPTAEIGYELAGHADKEAVLMPRRDLIQIIKALTWLPVIFISGIFLASDKARANSGTVLFVILGIYAAIVLYLWLSFTITNRQIMNSRLKVTVTGIITEVFNRLVDNEGSGYNSFYWYRIDNHLISGNLDDDRFAPGDKVRMVCLQNKNGQLENLISGEKIGY